MRAKLLPDAVHTASSATTTQRVAFSNGRSAAGTHCLWGDLLGGTLSLPYSNLHEGIGIRMCVGDGDRLGQGSVDDVDADAIEEDYALSQYRADIQAARERASLLLDVFDDGNHRHAHVGQCRIGQLSDERLMDIICAPNHAHGTREEPLVGPIWGTTGGHPSSEGQRTGELQLQLRFVPEVDFLDASSSRSAADAALSSSNMSPRGLLRAKRRCDQAVLSLVLKQAFYSLVSEAAHSRAASERRLRRRSASAPRPAVDTAALRNSLYQLRPLCAF